MAWSAEAGYSSLQGIRRAIGLHLNELYIGHAGAGSTADIIVDQELATEATDETHWAGAWFVGAVGANLGAVRRVREFDPSTAALVLSSALVTPPQLLEEYELHTLVSPVLINAAINLALDRIPWVERRKVDMGTITAYLNEAPYVPLAVLLGEGVPAKRLLSVGHMTLSTPLGSAKTITHLDVEIDGDYVRFPIQPPNEGYLVMEQVVAPGRLISDYEMTIVPLPWLMPGALSELYRMMSTQAPAQDAKRWLALSERYEAEFLAATAQLAPRPHVRVKPLRLVS